eukprot:c6396_g1_i1.p1 GENE.c6396_g1_i1~~c6396_g1_i1.p1  ORF type:complete len:339 (+),score=89.69 c6396_g1_i1:37-1017(+)
MGRVSKFRKLKACDPFNTKVQKLPVKPDPAQDRAPKLNRPDVPRKLMAVMKYQDMTPSAMKKAMKKAKEERANKANAQLPQSQQQPPIKKQKIAAPAPTTTGVKKSTNKFKLADSTPTPTPTPTPVTPTITLTPTNKNSKYEKDGAQTNIGKMKMRPGESAEHFIRRVNSVAKAQIQAIAMPSEKSDRNKRRRQKLNAKRKDKEIRKKLNKMGFDLKPADPLPSAEEIQRFTSPVVVHSAKEREQHKGETTVLEFANSAEPVAFGDVALEPPSLTFTPKLPKIRAGESKQEFEQRTMRALDSQSVVNQYRSLKRKRAETAKMEADD